MKKIIMSVIGLAIALALVVAIWVPLSQKSRSSAGENYNKAVTIDSDVTALSTPVTGSTTK